MFRRPAFDKVGGYRRACEFWEDLDLSLRIARHGRILVVPRALYRHRFAETSTRLTSARQKVEEAVDLMFGCRAAYRRGVDYELVLARRSRTGPPRKIHPYVFLSLGFITLWSGLRPPALSSLLRRGDVRPNGESVKALIWTAWASLSPLSLRAVMRVLLRWRNLRAARRLGETELWVWSPTLPQKARGTVGDAGVDAISNESERPAVATVSGTRLSAAGSRFVSR